MKMNINIFLIMFICLVSIALIIIGNAPNKEFVLLPIIPLYICTYLLYHDDWHNDSGAVG